MVTHRRFGRIEAVAGLPRDLCVGSPDRVVAALESQQDHT